MALQLVKKWGNSPAIRLPSAVMEAAHLKLDQAVEVRAAGRADRGRGRIVRGLTGYPRRGLRPTGPCSSLAGHRRPDLGAAGAPT